ncbi:hypothetical protein TNCV_610931 [Trichonephila clavipes]|nr:hypothetical protein TNCV_610931 [Trichonephila clavipes]
MDSWQACRELEPCSTEDLPCKGGGCTLNMPRLKRPPVEVVWNPHDAEDWRREGVQLRCGPRHLTVTQHCKVHHPSRTKLLTLQWCSSLRRGVPAQSFGGFLATSPSFKVRRSVPSSPRVASLN